MTATRPHPATVRGPIVPTEVCQDVASHNRAEAQYEVEQKYTTRVGVELKDLNLDMTEVRAT